MQQITKADQTGAEMKIIQVLTGAVACVSLIGVAPAYAAENAPAIGKLSVAKSASKLGAPVRVGTKVKKRNAGFQAEGEGGGTGTTGIVIGVMATAAIIGGVVAAADGGDDTPTSP